MRQPFTPFDPIEANRHGQQLFFADMFGPRKTLPRRIPISDDPQVTASALRSQPPAPHWLIPRHQQQTMFTMRPDLSGHGRTGLHQRAHPDDAAPLEAVAHDLADTHRWSDRQRRDAIVGIRIMLGLQPEGQAPIRASEVEALNDIGLPAWSVIEILSTADALIEDRAPHIDIWFHERVDPLPTPMAEELGIWFDVMKNGTPIPPRRRSRDHQTIQLHLQWALPTLRSWAADGHTSLREISQENVLDALPVSGPQRPRVGQGLKSIFRLLKGRKVLFVDPTARLKTGEHPARIPLPLDVDFIAARLRSDNPATACIVALLAFHGLRMQQLQRLQLIDIHDGRLTLEGRVIPLARPVQERLTSYLNERGRRHPETTNTHLFINRRTWRRQGPVGRRWIRLMIGTDVSARQLREDRILNEADASGGDVRALADLFGLSINAATRYISTLEAEDLTGHPPRHST